MKGKKKKAKGSARSRRRGQRVADDAADPGTQPHSLADQVAAPTSITVVSPRFTVGLAAVLGESTTVHGWFARQLVMVREAFGLSRHFRAKMMALIPLESETGAARECLVDVDQSQGIEVLDDDKHPHPTAIASIFAREMYGDLIVAFKDGHGLRVEFFDYGGDLLRRHMQNEGDGLTADDLRGPIMPSHGDLGPAQRARVQEIGKLSSRHLASGNCMFPLEAGGECGARAIASHAISQRAHLALIAEEGRVYQFRRHFLKAVFETPEPTPDLVGATSVAGVFPGFCSTHDSQFFRELDVPPLVLTPRTATLLHYRALAVDLHTKKATLAWQREAGGLPAVDELLDVIDRLMPLQLRYLVLAYRDRLLDKARMDRMVRTGGYGDIRFQWFRIARRPPVAGCAIVCADVDALGRDLQDQTGSLDPCEYLWLSILPEERSGLVVFTWLSSPGRVGERLVESIQALPAEKQAEWCLRILVGHSENVYWSPSWWRSLLPKQQEEWRQVMAVGVRPGVLLRLEPLVDWRFEGEGRSAEEPWAP